MMVPLWSAVLALGNLYIQHWTSNVFDLCREAKDVRAQSLPDTDPTNFSSTFCTALERAAAYAHIAHELDILDTQARIWKKRYNSLNFTCRLPVEMLSRIFLFVTESVQEIDSRDLGWIPCISHVCSHWRQVALDNPQLWSVVNGYWKQWAPEMLRRSKAVLLTIDVCLSTHTLENFVENVVKNLHRIRHLIIRVESKNDADLNEGHLSVLDNAHF
ncbi:hypothetical protein C0995_013409 [Termitomyces sp. Mi166|nr:hypothetical protein C0995_013409 [Termitomyces sp. Mi166\